MSLTMNKATHVCMLALLLVVASTALLPCHAIGTDIGTNDDYGKYCVGFPSCEQAPAWAINNCKTTCKFLDYDPDKSYCVKDSGGICCCLK